MSSEHLWVAPGDIVTDVSDRVQLAKVGEDGFRLSTQAEEGSVASSEVPFDDEAGDFYPVGLNAYFVRETLSDAADPYLYAGHFGSRREVRGPYRTGPSRQVNAQLQDANAILSRYVIRSDEGGNRPEENVTERMEWLVTTSAFTLHFDEATSILDTGSAVLSAGDLTDYTLEQILSDMSQQESKNYYVFYDGENEKYLLVYALDTGTHLTSALRFSNVEADVDDTTTFFLGLDTELDINPERLASYVAVRYANGRVDENDDDTASEFSRVDRVMDASLVKTAAIATERALGYLADLDDEELIVSGTVFLPAAKASQFRAGMRVQMKATHLTGMSGFVWVRLLAATVTQISEDPTLSYALAFEGTFSPGSAETCGTAITGAVDYVSGNTLIGCHDWSSGPIGATVGLSPATSSVIVAGMGFIQCSFQPGPFTAVSSPYTMVGPATADLGVSGYRANTTTGGTFAASFTGGDIARRALVAASFPTAAAAPASTGAQISTGNIATLSATPTPGNLLVCVTMELRTEVVNPAAGWTEIARDGSLVVFDGLHGVGLLISARCVEEGDTTSIAVPGGSNYHCNWVTEWEMA